VKLLFCPHCNDVLKLQLKVRKCQCGKSSGCIKEKGCWDVDAHAKPRDVAVLNGAAIPLGFENHSFAMALLKRKTTLHLDGLGDRFDAFVIPPECPTVEYKEEKIHINSAGLIGGYSACGDKEGDCVEDEKRVTCPKCIKIIVDCLTQEKKSPEQIAKVLGKPLSEIQP